MRNIDSNWLIFLDKENLILGGSRALLCRFIGQLVGNEVVNDEKLERIVECSSVFYIYSKQGELSTLSSTSSYTEFKSKNEFLNKFTIRKLLYPEV